MLLKPLQASVEDIPGGYERAARRDLDPDYGLAASAVEELVPGVVPGEVVCLAVRLTGISGCGQASDRPAVYAALFCAELRIAVRPYAHPAIPSETAAIIVSQAMPLHHTPPFMACLSGRARRDRD